IRAIVQPWWVCRVTQLSYVSYMRFLGKNLLYCSSVMSVTVALVSWGLRPTYLLLMASAFCATVIYAFGCWRLIFNEGERDQLLASISGRGANRAELAASAVTL